jgi:hypothetical protein
MMVLEYWSRRNEKEKEKNGKKKKKTPIHVGWWRPLLKMVLEVELFEAPFIFFGCFSMV